MSDKAILLLVSLGLVSLALLLSFLLPPKNCWDNYVTENEAIINCEGKN